ncbi:hypothetical protein GGTG_08890 [Gaeumannomyces tritici R3-111a-1]|uniref:Tyrosinase copper-binding domain-containing protein n=1 Tax=Gaeumannomyces tritici (strain R3-111a-1) TaxID=644352 RepID=J3P5V0_GAET3|nr:hypothetical protein GGTG_08890 [Gaeumannomyces tritici R3-111a-1]EJT75052.1 hypothetical protein GGTG_08890 [Gaeumannomyces tritici R3-111a-1]
MRWIFIALLGLAARLEARQGCTRPLVRREWRTLDDEEKAEYISAVQCMLDKPSRSNVAGATRRYDDFVATHIIQADRTHFVGFFYPHHRLLVAAFEYALRKECGYGGAQPYWDWLLDIDDMAASPIFDPDTGFGGNGEWIPGTQSQPSPEMELPLPSTHEFPDRSGGGCIPDGPFEGLDTALGPRGSVAYNPRCVRRDFCPATFARMVANVRPALRMPTYGDFVASSEPNAHASGHYGVGGLYGAMTDKWSSPVDPVFWLHHANVDRMWWSWQYRDLPERLMDISGPLVSLDWTNKLGGNITLEHENALVTLGQGTSVASTMDIRGGFLCYDYEGIY